MNSYKHTIDSSILRRNAHVDIFEIGATPRFLFILMGGSGIDDEEYARRRHSVIPCFDSMLGNFERSISFILAHVTAPFDLPFNRFAAEPEATDKWNQHISEELLAKWWDMPRIMSGFSGGSALALNGLHRDRACFGGAAFGADAIPTDFECPGHWKENLKLFGAPDDRVFHHPTNQENVNNLVLRQQAEVFELWSGRHSLSDYCTMDGVGAMISLVNDLL